MKNRQTNLEMHFELDMALFGNAFYIQGPDGKKARIDPLNISYGFDTWVYIKVNQKKLFSLDRLEEQLRKFVERKIGKNNIRNIKLGYDGDDIVQQKFTVAIRRSALRADVPHETI
jgi:hypothetical protein